MASSENLDERIRSIEDRNKRVEIDKVWETSFTRKVLIAIFTYLAVALYLQAIGISNSWLSAIVPTLGFMLALANSFRTYDWLKQYQPIDLTFNIVQQILEQEGASYVYKA